MSREDFLVMPLTVKGQGQGPGYNELVKQGLIGLSEGIRDKGKYSFGSIGEVIVGVYKKDNAKFKLENLKDFLLKLKEFCIENGIKKITMPLNAFSKEGIDVELATMLVAKIFNKSDIEVVC